MGVLMVTDNLTLLACESGGSTTCTFDPDDPSRPAGETFEASMKLTPVRSEQDIEALLDGKGGKPLFVEFYSSNCPICRKIVPIVRTIKESCLHKNLQVLTVNVSLKENRHLARRYGVVGVPTFVFLRADGTETARLIGYQQVEELERPLQALTEGQCQGFARLPQEP